MKKMAIIPKRPIIKLKDIMVLNKATKFHKVLIKLFHDEFSLTKGNKS